MGSRTHWITKKPWKLGVLSRQHLFWNDGIFNVSEHGIKILFNHLGHYTLKGWDFEQSTTQMCYYGKGYIM